MSFESVKEFFQDYGWMMVVIIVVVSTIVFLMTGTLSETPLESDSELDLDSLRKELDLRGVTWDNLDANYTEAHLALAGNQQFILDEIQKLNLFSQCIIDTDNIVLREIPIDDAGGFRRVSVVPLICPELVK